MIRAIVTDIEGTTSDIRFVHNVLLLAAGESVSRRKLSRIVLTGSACC
jgi:methionine salvage enolase-phosphatase E1